MTVYEGRALQFMFIVYGQSRVYLDLLKVIRSRFTIRSMALYFLLNFTLVMSMPLSPPLPFKVVDLGTNRVFPFLMAV